MYTQVIYQFGDVLPNGATVVESTVAPNKQAYVLAVANRVPTEGSPIPQEWITWAVDEKGDTFYGRYFVVEENAKEDLKKRAR